MFKKVPPAGKKGAKLLIVGESPGNTEVELGKPFVGPSGEKLFGVLNRYGVTYDDVYIINLSPYQPIANYIGNAKAEWIEEGLKQIHEYINLFSPNCILALGDTVLWYLTGRDNVSAHRGSVLPCNQDSRCKVVSSYHPSFILRNPGLHFLFDFDIRRAVEQSKSKEFPYLNRNYYIADDDSIELGFARIRKAVRVAVDIETTKADKRIISIGFAISPTESYSFQWSPTVQVYAKEVLEDPNITKIFHYGWGFDIPFLEYFCGIETKGIIHDTYILAHAIDPTLPRDLGFLTSIWTHEPYYKAQGRDTLPGDSKSWGSRIDKSDVYIYNAKDCAITYEIFEAISGVIEQEDADTYEFEREDAALAYQIGKNGLPFSEDNREKLRNGVILKWHKYQLILNAIALGSFNVNSPPQVKKLLYETFKLPVRKKNNKITTGDAALVSLIGYTKDRIDSVITPAAKAKWSMPLNALLAIRSIRGLRKLISSYIDIDVSPDGRLRSLYNAAGAYTGRWSATKYIDDTGLNPQTFPRLDFQLPTEGDNIESFKAAISSDIKSSDTSDESG